MDCFIQLFTIGKLLGLQSWKKAEPRKLLCALLASDSYDLICNVFDEGKELL